MNFIRKNKLIMFCLGTILLMCFINLIAWNSSAFCDMYAEHIFPVLVNVLSRFTSLFSFSVGEILIILGILTVLISPILYIILMIIKKGRRKKVTLYFARFFSVVFAFIATVMTMNCFILYHCTRLQEKSDSAEYTSEEFADAMCIIINNLAELAPQVTRDEHGCFVLSDALDATTVASMEKLGDDIPKLSGFYPRPKAITHSYFMSQQYLGGVYFPFSLEANYNKAMTDINFPSTCCHELAHLKGIIQEDEANYVSFLACINSDSVDFRYSGYINAYEYFNNESFDDDGEVVNEILMSRYMDGTLRALPDEVFNDIYSFVPKTYWEDNSSLEIIPTEFVDEVSDVATNTSLKLNGVEDGVHSYSRVVELIISHYGDGIKW